MFSLLLVSYCKSIDTDPCQHDQKCYSAATEDIDSKEYVCVFY